MLRIGCRLGLHAWKEFDVPNSKNAQVIDDWIKAGRSVMTLIFAKADAVDHYRKCLRCPKRQKYMVVGWTDMMGRRFPQEWVDVRELN